MVVDMNTIDKTGAHAVFANAVTNNGTIYLADAEFGDKVMFSEAGYTQGTIGAITFNGDRLMSAAFKDKVHTIAFDDAKVASYEGLETLPLVTAMYEGKAQNGASTSAKFNNWLMSSGNGLDREEVIAIGNDESLATGIYARKDSPILGHTGYNALYPEMAGTGGTVRGKTILCTAGSSAHYTVHKWLEALSLTEKEVTIKDMPSEEALKAFLNGEGDAVALWSPYTLEAEQHGLMPVTLSSQCDASQPTLLLANKAFAKEHPALVTAFLKMYFRGITALQETPREQLIQDYRAFYHAWTGRDLPPQDAAWELAKHPVYGLKGQLTLFDPAQKKLHTWLQELASFAGGKNRLSDVTDVYLKKLAQ